MPVLARGGRWQRKLRACTGQVEKQAPQPVQACISMRNCATPPRVGGNCKAPASKARLAQANKHVQCNAAGQVVLKLKIPGTTAPYTW
jgi:hypothetical protein